MSVQVHSPTILPADSPSSSSATPMVADYFYSPSPRMPHSQILDMYPKPSHSRRHSFNNMNFLNHPSRPVSPLVSTARPSSRSEKLLRETLRRADQQERVNAAQRKDEDSDCECDNIDTLLRASPPREREVTRRKSIGHSPRHAPSSPRMRLKRSAESAPVLPPLPRDAMVTPHDAVLRSRLESVLQHNNGAPTAQSQPRRNSNSRSVSRARSHTRGSSEDWTSDSHSPQYAYYSHHPSSSPRQGLIEPITPPLTPLHTASVTLYSPPSYPNTSPNSPRSRPSQIPSSPSFNARTASAACRQIDGYVSFANVEGLGAPADIDHETDDNGGRKWFKWFGLKPTSAIVNA